MVWEIIEKIENIRNWGIYWYKEYFLKKYFFVLPFFAGEYWGEVIKHDCNIYLYYIPMKQKVVYGYTDRYARAVFIFTGIVVLVWLNLLFVVWVRYPGIKRRWLGVLAIMSRVFWRMWRIQKKLHYIFDKTGITIVLPSGKKFHLPQVAIESTKQVPYMARRSGRGIKYIPRKQEVHFTTSTHHLLYILMKDGRTIVISPKEYPKR